MDKFLMIAASISMGVFAFSSKAHATLLAYEGFDYTPAANTSGTNGGTGWASGSSWSNIAVNAGSIGSGSLAPTGDFWGLETSGNHVVQNSGRTGRFLDTSVSGVFDSAGLLNGNGDIGADNTTVYISFMQRSLTEVQNFSFELHRDNLNDAGRVTEIGNIFGANTIYLRKSGTSPTLGASDTNVNFYVMRIDFNAATGADAGKDLISVWRNPTLGTEPVSPVVNQVVFDDLSFDGISVGQFTSNTDVYHDEFRIGTTYSSVTPVPEPGTFAFFAGMAALAWMTVRRRYS